MHSAQISSVRLLVWRFPCVPYASLHRLSLQNNDLRTLPSQFSCLTLLNS